MSGSHSVTARPPNSGAQTPQTVPLDHIKIVAPLTGTLSVKVSEGSLLKEGDVIAVQISSKTELDIKAPKAGYVRRLARDGVTLNENDQIAEFEVL